jgi:small subunit ribosomal protein S13
MPREFQHIIRIADTDLDGTLKVDYALTKIKGVGIRLAEVIAKKAKVNIENRLGFLSDAEVKRIKDVVENPSKYDVPGWLLNRSKDSKTGNNLHMTSWKGIRHAYGLKVRGQRTRTTGRKGRVVGVKKKRELRKLRERG